MKTFRLFLESHDITNNKNTVSIGGKSVHTEFEDNGGGHHSVFYSVDRQTDKKDTANLSSHHKEAIARHVGRVIHNFMKTKKPKSLVFAPANEEHEEAFKQFSQKLADHHGYDYDFDKPTGYHFLTKKKA